MEVEKGTVEKKRKRSEEGKQNIKNKIYDLLHVVGCSKLTEAVRPVFFSLTFLYFPPHIVIRQQKKDPIKA